MNDPHVHPHDEHGHGDQRREAEQGNPPHGHDGRPHEHDAQSRGPGDHAHGAGHGHHPGHDRAWWARLRHDLAHLFTPHSHDASGKVDRVMEASAEGMRTLWISLAILGTTAVLQAAVVALSGSVALLGDSIHNAADALTAVPLGIAFMAGRRPANRRFTYGFGRAEDLAGIFIVTLIALSAALAAVAAISRLVHPATVSYLPAVAVAAVIGFIGNESVARYRIRVGRKIGSAALVADGLHARTDGFTSLAVLLGAAGVALGWRLADPIIGILITVAILLVLRNAAREVFGRLMDAVSPDLIDTAETTLRGVDGVVEVGTLRMRWIGHHLRAEVTIVVSEDLSVRAAHEVAVQAEHALLHAIPRLSAALVHADPAPSGENDPHALLAHHVIRGGDPPIPPRRPGAGTGRTPATRRAAGPDSLGRYETASAARVQCPPAEPSARPGLRPGTSGR
jgi:cation diffusion facilitator family transporter